MLTELCEIARSRPVDLAFSELKSAKQQVKAIPADNKKIR